MANLGGNVPVAEAVAVNAAAVPAGIPADKAAAAVPALTEVRKAESAGVDAAVQSEHEAMQLPPPPPIRF